MINHGDHSNDIFPPFDGPFISLLESLNNPLINHLLSKYNVGKNWTEENEKILYENGCIVDSGNQGNDDDDGDDGQYQTIITIEAKKIICNNEDYLPDLSGNSGVDLVSEYEKYINGLYSDVCHENKEWEFEWGYANAVEDESPDNNSEKGGTGWNAFTDSVDVPVDLGQGRILVREKFKDGYLEFSGDENGPSESAEFYCTGDVLHYDNLEWIEGYEPGQEFFCVAWNVPKPEPEKNYCRVEVVSDGTNKVYGTSDNAVELDWIHSAWTAVIDGGAKWIWGVQGVDNPEADETYAFEKTFNVGDVKDAVLEIASDNSYKAYINDCEWESSIEDNYQTATQYSVPTDCFNEKGGNTIKIEVKNWGQAEGTPESNPAGLLYRLAVNEESNNWCEPQETEEDLVDITICKYEFLEEEREPEPLSGWEFIVLQDGEETYSTGEEGNCVTIKADPTKSLEVYEKPQEGWRFKKVEVENGGTIKGHIIEGEEGDGCLFFAEGNGGIQLYAMANPEFTCSFINEKVDEGPECDPTVNLFENHGFEEPVVLRQERWDIFRLLFNPLLKWSHEPEDEGIELQNNVPGIGSAHSGDQHAELGANVATYIWQSVRTIPGYTYKIVAWYSPRPNTPKEDNVLEFMVGDSPLGEQVSRDGIGNTESVWSEETRTFEAYSPYTSVGFRKVGGAGNLGVYLDDVGLYCIPTQTGDDDDNDDSSTTDETGDRTTHGGGGSSRNRLSSSSSEGEVLGEQISQVSALPISAPATGFGGLQMCLF